MNLGQASTLWTARAAMLLAAAALGIGWARGTGERWMAAARWVWTLGLAAFLVHVVCAFAFYHDWSHRRAYETTALQTEQVVGLKWGGGLYFNYALMLLWTADVAWWWLDAAGRHRRPRLLTALWHGYFILLAFNATVVFTTGAPRVVGLVACAALAGCWWWGRSNGAPSAA